MTDDQIVALQRQIEEQNKAIQKLIQQTKRKDMDDDKFMEPQSFLTKMLAKWSPRVDERTRIMSYEELDWMDSNMLLSQVLGVPVYGVEATTHMRLLISKDGLSRQEVVQGIQALNMPIRGFDTGLPLLTDAISNQKEKR